MGISDIVDNFDFLHCINRRGFVFTSIIEPANILDAIVVRNPINCKAWSPQKSFSQHSLEDHIKFINQNKIEKACIIAENIEFITKCPSLKYIEIIPADTAINFDYSPLYKMPDIKYLFCKTMYGREECRFTSIDYSRINGLVEINISGKGHLNYDKVNSIEKLYISEQRKYFDLRNFNGCKNIKKLCLFKCTIKSLIGISILNSLQQLVLEDIRILTDISELEYIAHTLRSLRISNCPKIDDFTCLYSLKNLEHLELLGNNELPNLEFLSQMKKLKTFSFSIKIKNKNLIPCLQVPYVICVRNRKEYNLKDKDLPKQLFLEPFKIL